jgi:hypothetical protein
MDPSLGILLLTIAAFVGILATVILLAARGRRADEAASQLAASSEGSTVCPSCGSPNLVTDTDCLYCGAPLPEVKPLA